MALSYSICDQLGLVHIRIDGTVTGDELRSLYDTYLSDPGWHPTYSVLWDGRYISELVISWTAVEAMVQTTLAHRDDLGPGRTAFVVFRAADFEAAEIYPRLVGLLGYRDPGRVVRVFGSLAAAADWLGVPAGAVTIERPEAA